MMDLITFGDNRMDDFLKLVLAIAIVIVCACAGWFLLKVVFVATLVAGLIYMVWCLYDYAFGK